MDIDMQVQETEVLSLDPCMEIEQISSWTVAYQVRFAYSNKTFQLGHSQDHTCHQTSEAALNDNQNRQTQCKESPTEELTAMPDKVDVDPEVV